MEFCADGIEYPNHGVVNGTYEFQFLLPSGLYKFPTIFQQPDRIKKVVCELIPKCRKMWPEWEDETIAEKVYDHCRAAILLNPTLELEHPRMTSILLVFCSATTIDDMIDQENVCQNPFASYKAFNSLLPYIMEFAQEGPPETTESLPALNAELVNLKEFSSESFHLGNNCIPDYARKLRSAFAYEVRLTFAANIIDSDLKAQGLSLSYGQSIECERYISAYRPLLEYLAICHDIELTPFIRADILLQAIVNLYSDITIFTNSILGLSRDIRLRQTGGPLMHLVHSKNLSLQEAVDQVYQQLLEAYKDYKIFTEKFLDTYSEDENAVKYVQLMGYILDGTNYGYPRAARYGIQDRIKMK